MVKLSRSISEAMKEMGLQSPEEKRAEEEKDMEGMIKLRNMSDDELERGVKFSTGIEGYAARSEKERRLWSRGVLSIIATFGTVFLTGWFVWEFVK